MYGLDASENETSLDLRGLFRTFGHSDFKEDWKSEICRFEGCFKSDLAKVIPAGTIAYLKNDTR